jgi:hypothetical protein
MIAFDSHYSPEELMVCFYWSAGSGHKSEAHNFIIQSRIAMETPYILKTNITKEDGKLLNPIIMRKYIGVPLSMCQRSNLAVLYNKYGEMNIEGCIFHGTRSLGKKDYEAHPREVNDSYYEDSEDTVVISPPPEPRPITKFINRRSCTTECETPEPVLQPVSARHRAKGIVAYGSNCSPSKSPPKAEKPSAEEKPHWSTLDELVAKAKASTAARDVISLSKRSPELKSGDHAKEEQVTSKKIQRVRQRRGFIPRSQPFKLWIEEHKKKIAEGKVPTRAEYVWEAIEESRIGELDEIKEYAGRIGSDWDQLYSKNFDPVFAERELREPGVRREGWQRMKDKREQLRTKQYPGLEWRRLIALEKAKKANAKAQEESRLHETIDEEAKRLKGQRKIDHKRYRERVAAQGGEVRERLEPEEQKKARKTAQADYARTKRAAKKDEK